MKTNWPQGKALAGMKKQLSGNHELVLTGRMLAIDPASGGSSMPGWAIYEAGQFIAGGVIELRSRDPINKRLQLLMKRLQLDFSDLDVLALEKIRGRSSHDYLKWSVGVTVASCPATVFVEVPTSMWRAIRPENYIKTDAADAALIGRIVVLIAEEMETEG
jgi:hypothetical protein